MTLLLELTRVSKLSLSAALVGGRRATVLPASPAPAPSPAAATTLPMAVTIPVRPPSAGARTSGNTSPADPRPPPAVLAPTRCLPRTGIPPPRALRPRTAHPTHAAGALLDLGFVHHFNRRQRHQKVVIHQQLTRSHDLFHERVRDDTRAPRGAIGVGFRLPRCVFRPLLVAPPRGAAGPPAAGAFGPRGAAAGARGAAAPHGEGRPAHPVPVAKVLISPGETAREKGSETERWWAQWPAVGAPTPATAPYVHRAVPVSVAAPWEVAAAEKGSLRVVWWGVSPSKGPRPGPSGAVSPYEREKKSGGENGVPGSANAFPCPGTRLYLRTSSF